MRMTWILEDRLAASGMISSRDLPALADSGIRAVVSLTHRNPFPAGSPDGLGHVHLPVLDIIAPFPGQIEEFEAQFLASAPLFFDHLHCDPIEVTAECLCLLGYEISS